MKTTPLSTAVILLTCVACIAGAKTRPSKPADSPRPFSFSFLPKSLAKNPEITCNIITEVSPLGKKVRGPTSENPAYYALQPGYYQHLGEAAPAGLVPPPVSELTEAMMESLSASHYLEAHPPAKPPTLIIIFSYGDHSVANADMENTLTGSGAGGAGGSTRTPFTLLQDALVPTLSGSTENNAPKDTYSSETSSAIDSMNLSAEQLVKLALVNPRKHRELLDRAGLVGGSAFAKQLSRVLKEEAAYQSTNSAFSEGQLSSAHRLAEMQREFDQRNSDVMNALGYNAGGGTVERSMASLIGEMPGMMISNGPFHIFYRKNSLNMHLIEDSCSSCYFVIASAYDGAALATTGEKRLLWRTKMTVNSIGVKMDVAMHAIIHAAGPYFGRKMTQTATVSKRLLNDQRTKIDAVTAPAQPDNSLPATTPEPKK